MIGLLHIKHLTVGPIDKHGSHSDHDQTAEMVRIKPIDSVNLNVGF